MISTKARPRLGDVRIGTSGWLYREWRGTFYPPKLPQSRELEHIGALFNSLEINATFYRLQKPAHFRHWAAIVPDDFVFAVKGSRFITHMLRLRNARGALANFFAQGVLLLGEKLGPILWQLPPNFQFDKRTLEEFFALLPRDTGAASKLAREHTRKGDATWTRATTRQPLRYALEIRHESFLTPDFIRLLRRHRIALVCADTPGWPLRRDVTSDFVYCRLHGGDQLYVSDYSARQIGAWAKLVDAWRTGGDPKGRHITAAPPPSRKKRDVYVYFDNTAKIHAPANALALAARVRALSRP